jgi:Protein of unknown function (DUF3500)
MKALPYLLSVSLLVGSLFTPSAVRAHDAGHQMAEVAKAFLGTLEPEQKARAVFPFAGEERENWHFIPRVRVGLPMKDMRPQQRLLAQALLCTGLGESGLLKAMTIMSLEEVLYQMEGATQEEPKRSEVRAKRDPEMYFVSIFGEPANTGIWGWRVEGHHLSLNFTVKDGNLLRATPSFFGTNPGEVREGPLTGLRVLSVEEECGRSLVKALTEAQFAKAKFSDEAPKEMLTAAEKTVSRLEPAGLSESEMTVGQKAMLHRLVSEYLNRLKPEIAETAWNEIKNSGPMSFAWAGGKELGDPHYYRVQGPTFLLEYDNVQNGANHVHCVWRDFDGDFGRDILGEHHKKEH